MVFCWVAPFRLVPAPLLGLYARRSARVRESDVERSEKEKEVGVRTTVNVLSIGIFLTRLGGRDRPATVRSR